MKFFDSLQRHLLAMLFLVLSVSGAHSKPWKSAEMITKDTYKYGAFEARIRGAEGSGQIMAFFLYKYGSEWTGAEWQEQDFELFGKNGKFQTQVMTPGKPRTEHVVVHQLKTPVWERYYTYRMEWTPKAVAFYVDGKLIRKETDTAIYWKLLDTARAEPMAMRISLWAGDYDWSGLLDQTKIPGHIDVNWAQVYKYTPGTGPGGSDFTPLWKDDFNTLDNNRWYFANWTFDVAVNDYSTGNVRVQNGVYQAFLTSWEMEGKQFSEPLVDDGLLFPPTTENPVNDSSPVFPAPAVALPARISAAAVSAYFDSSSRNSGNASCSRTGVDAQVSADTVGGRCNVGWLKPGEWMEYQVTSAQDMTYDLHVRVGSGASGGSFKIQLDGVDLSAPLVVPKGSWTSFQNLILPGIQIPAGAHTVRYTQLASEINVKNLDFRLPSSGLEPEPTTVAGPILLPATVLAKQYSGALDLTTGNSGGACRTGDVDLQNSTDLYGGCNIGWFEVGEWVEYSVLSQGSTDYDLFARVAGLATPGASFDVLVDGVVLNPTPVRVPGSGWSVFQTVPVGQIRLTPGLHTIRIVVRTDRFNFHWLTIAKAGMLSAAPEKVTGLNLVTSNRGSALNWNPSSRAVTYKVYRSISNLAWRLVADQVGTTLVETGLTNGAVHRYFVVASNFQGASPSSDTVQGTPSAPPSADVPTGLVAVPGVGQVQLQWVPGPNNLSFRLERSVSGEPFTVIAAPSAPSYLDANLVVGTTYSYRVSGVVGDSISQPTAVVTATPVGAPPAPVSGLVGQAGNQKTNLSWASSSGAESYQVFRSTAADQKGEQVGEVTATTFVDFPLVNGVEYFYSVIAANQWSASAPSSKVSVIPAPPVVAPPSMSPAGGLYTSVQSVSLSAPNADSIEFSFDGANWTRFATPISVSRNLRIYARSYQESVVSTTISDSFTIVIVPQPSISPAGGEFNAAQTISVVADGADSIQVSADGSTWTRYTGPFSVAVTRQVHARAFLGGFTSAPVVTSYRIVYLAGVPTDLQATAGVGQVALQWTPGANNSSWVVYRSANGLDFVRLAATAVPSFTDLTGAIGTIYHYAVVGKNPDDTSVLSQAVQAMATGEKPAKVTGLVATASDAQVTLSWSPVTGASAYRIVRSTAGGTASLLAEVPGVSYLDQSLVNGTTYSYRIVASNRWGTSDTSALVSAIPQAPVASVKVQYLAGSTSASTNGIAPRLKLVNTGAAAVPLSEITIRYWYTNEGGKSQSFWCDWAQVGSANVKGTFKSVSPIRTNADTYLEIGFSTAAGTLAAGGNSGEIQARFSKSDWSNYTQTNDASFDATKISYTDWNRVTVYRNGVLIWGVEP